MPTRTAFLACMLVSATAWAIPQDRVCRSGSRPHVRIASEGPMCVLLQDPWQDCAEDPWQLSSWQPQTFSDPWQDSDDPWQPFHAQLASTAGSDPWQPSSARPSGKTGALTGSQSLEDPWQPPGFLDPWQEGSEDPWQMR